MRSGLRFMLVGAALGALASDVVGQGVELGLGLDAFVDYPEAFSEGSCRSSAIGLTASGAWRALPALSVEARSTLAGETGATLCAIASRAPIPPDTPFERHSYADDVEGASLFAVHLSAVLEPWPTSAISPRARVGLGRLLNKGMPNWLWGLGLRYTFGRHAFVTDVVGWNLTFDRVLETVIFRSASGRFDVLSTEQYQQEAHPFLVSIGWEVAVR